MESGEAEEKSLAAAFRLGEQAKVIDWYKPVRYNSTMYLQIWSFLDSDHRHSQWESFRETFTFKLKSYYTVG